jgi:hypothetical protein
MTQAYFEMPPHIFAGEGGSGIILLDLKKNSYIKLAGKEKDFFCQFLEGEFFIEEGKVKPHSSFYKTNIQGKSYADIKDLKKYLDFFIEKEWLSFSKNNNRKNIINLSAMKDNLKDRQWRIQKIPSFSKTSKFLIIKAFVALCHVNYILAKHGIYGLLDYLEKRRKIQSKDFTPNSYNQAMSLSHALNLACLFFPKKITCLPWAGTMASLLLTHGISFTFVIGIQDKPFFAHAWIESEGKVVNDNNDLSKYMIPMIEWHSL